MNNNGQMENLTTIQETIDAIMAGKFQGALVGPDGIEYRDFFRLGYMPRDLHDGQRVDRIRNPDMRLACRFLDGHSWSGGLEGFTPEKLRSMFETGMVVKGSAAYSQRSRNEVDRSETPEFVAKRGQAIEMMSVMVRQADKDRRGLLIASLSSMDILGEPDEAMGKMRELSAMTNEQISNVVLGHDRPSL